MNDSTDTQSPQGTGDSFGEHVTRTLRLAPLPPKNWFINQTGNGLVFIVSNRGTLGTDSAVSGAQRYDIHFAADVDTSTAAGIDAGYVRSRVVCSIPAVNIEDMQSESNVLVSADYQTGYFYCVGVSAGGDRSAYDQPRHVSSGIQSQEIPGLVTHLQVTESGEMHNGTVYSALAVSLLMPNPIGGATGVQLVLDHYPNLDDTSEWVTKQYDGLGGGSMQFKELAQVCRRVGIGTITVTVGSTAFTGTSSQFKIQMRAGDYIEIAGTRAQVASVTNDGAGVLSAVWAGARSYVAFASWEVIGLVRVYARAVSDGGVSSADLSGLPYVDVLLDGNLSAPNAPTITGSNRGDAIVITFPSVVGSQIKGYRLYRGLGVSIAFDQCLATDWVDQPKDVTSASTLLEFIDKDFTSYQRENGQTFTYYVVTVNERDEMSAPSTGVNVIAQLISPADGGGTVPARFVAPSLLWDGMLAGTAGDVNLAGASQDANMGIVRPAGFNQWVGSTTGTGSTPAFQNGTEVLLAIAGGAGATGSSILSQRIAAWDSANGRLPKGKMVTVQFKAYHTPGTVNGSLLVQIAHYNGGVFQALSHLRTRDSGTDAVVFTANTLQINGTDLPNTPTMYWGSFLLLTTGTTDEIDVAITYDTTNYSGVNIVITEPMLSLGDGLPYWSPLIDPNTIYGPPTGGATIPPGRFIDRDGSGRDIIGLP